MRFVPSLALACALGAAIAAPAAAQPAAPQGMPQGMPHDMPHGMMSQEAPQGAPYSPEDAAAILDARLAALKTVLKLTPEQEKLWPPVEASIRDAVKGAVARREARMAAPPPATALDVLAIVADSEEARAKALKAFVVAAKPFAASLTPAQLHRLPAFIGLHETGTMPESTQLWIFEEEE
ncbi:Spy/CpxP family protein refolding chaperone [Xanthobacter albus]|uniref:Spy/CpxP family protein refolding chaperone n=1 Tax=Xanthobacter albus TaxID=3119929 RepID=UPI00372D74E7